MSSFLRFITRMEQQLFYLHYVEPDSSSNQIHKSNVRALAASSKNKSKDQEKTNPFFSS